MSKTLQFLLSIVSQTTLKPPVLYVTGLRIVFDTANSASALCETPLKLYQQRPRLRWFMSFFVFSANLKTNSKK
jgi:hypothetical protein